MINDFHPGKQLAEIRRDQLLQQHESRLALDDGHEPRQQLLRNFDAREDAVVGLRVAHKDGKTEREVGDIWKRSPEPDRERRKHRKHLAPEALEQLRALIGRDIAERDHADIVLSQRGTQHLVEQQRLAIDLRLNGSAQHIDRLARIEPGAEFVGHAGLDLIVQPGDADHEELVEIRSEDRGELDALQQRLGLVLGELQDTVVEGDPRDLAVERKLGVS